jgi:hypothetical protein
MGSLAVGRGDIVRFEHAQNGLWFYCRVEALGEDGELVCKVIDAQSWVDLALDGLVPGRAYTMHTDHVLSVVRPAS